MCAVWPGSRIGVKHTHPYVQNWDALRSLLPCPLLSLRWRSEYWRLLLKGTWLPWGRCTRYLQRDWKLHTTRYQLDMQTNVLCIERNLLLTDVCGSLLKICLLAWLSINCSAVWLDSPSFGCLLWKCWDGGWDDQCKPLWSTPRQAKQG